MNLYYPLVLLLLFFAPNFKSTHAEPTIITIFSVVKGIDFIFDKSVDFYKLVSGNDDPFHLKSNERRLYQSIANVTSMVKNLEFSIPQMTIASIKELEKDFSEIVHFEIKLDDLVKHINKIESMYSQFLKLSAKVKKKLDNDTSLSEKKAIERTLDDFSRGVVSFNTGSIRDSLSEINDLIDVRGASSFYNKNDILTLILNNFNDKTRSRCIIDKSPQQLIFDTYTSLRLVQLKGEVLFEFAYMILYLYSQEDHRSDMIDLHDELLSRFKKQAKVVSEVIQTADNSYWKCDPDKHKLGVTYTELTHLVQGYIHNERELSHKDSCFEGCDNYAYTNSPRCSNEDALCRQQPSCKGRVFDCKFVDEDFTLCFANVSSGRRYDWIKYKSGYNIGKANLKCSVPDTFVKGYRYWLAWRCMYCFCMCDEENGRSDRYFSLEPAVSNIEENKVVVGVQFVKQNRIMHLRVKEAKLLPGGAVDNATTSWVVLPQLDIDSWADRPKIHKLSYESRAMDLDDLLAPPKFLVTGVKFRLLGAHLNLEIRLTSFDFETGQLHTNLTYWKGNDNTDITPDAARSEFTLHHRILPTDYPKEYNAPDSVSDSYLEFLPSDQDTDAAQSTVPFIDIQSVVPSPPIPLVGVGIIHKGAYSTAGYVEPKVFTLNIAEMVLNL